ncbi:MAG: hypothetical protein II132_00515, partial [Desulfovibrio sp.]|nr:hypothetical protein [Desulfovibrio sp.]
MSELESYTEVTTESWGSRLRDSLKGIIFGILLFLGGTALLWWNEGRTVSVGDAINEAERVVEELPAVASVDPAFDNKLVHAFGRAETKAGVKDPDFPGIEVKGIALRHSVEFYQMVEHKKTEKHKNAGGSETTVTTYTYSNEWVSHPVTQSFAKRPNNNMVLLDVKGSTTYAQDATLGAYSLDSRLVRDIGGEKALDCGFTDEKLQRLQNALPLHVKSGRLLWNTGPNALYIGADPNHARIGDVRVKFYYVPESEISILALASGGVFKTWRASNNQDFFRVELGKQEVPQMIQGARDDNAMMCWIFRALGCILVIAGLRMILAPISVVLDVLPLLGDIAELGLSLVAGLIGFAWSFIVIAIAWIRFRPVLGLCLLAAAVALIAFVIMRGRKRAQTPGQPMAPGMPGQPVAPFPGQPGGQAQAIPGQQFAPQPEPSLKEKLGGVLQQISQQAQQSQQPQQQSFYGQPQAPQGAYGQPQAPYGQAPQGPYGQPQAPYG